MSHTRNNNVQNHWLTMLDSVEENLKYYWPDRALSAHVARQNAPVTAQTNAWLNSELSAENRLETLSPDSENPDEQMKMLRRKKRVSGRAYRLIQHVQSLGSRLVEYTTPTHTRELHAEYGQLADQIMPTLARINQRMTARRQMPEISYAAQGKACLHDDTLDVALRAAQKRRC